MSRTPSFYEIHTYDDTGINGFGVVRAGKGIDPSSLVRDSVFALSPDVVDYSILPLKNTEGQFLLGTALRRVREMRVLPDEMMSRIAHGVAVVALSRGKTRLESEIIDSQLS